jgi:hypothetical protein
VKFDESNGSQVEQVDEVCVGKEIPAEKAIKKMVIGEVKPQEEDDEDCEIIEESPSAPPTANYGESRENPGDSGIPGNSRNSRPPTGDSQNNQENEDLIKQEASDPHPRVRQSVQRDHSIDNILGTIHRG